LNRKKKDLKGMIHYVASFERYRASKKWQKNTAILFLNTIIFCIDDEIINFYLRVRVYGIVTNRCKERQENNLILFLI
jgi:hypothetical protein